MCSRFFTIFFFFFQAEDGIRDLTVTGVQTCALPICRNNRFPMEEMLRRQFTVARSIRRFRPEIVLSLMGSYTQSARFFGVRSEERRVGKECRSRCSP